MFKKYKNVKAPKSSFQHKCIISASLMFTKMTQDLYVS